MFIKKKLITQLIHFDIFERKETKLLLSSTSTTNFSSNIIMSFQIF